MDETATTTINSLVWVEMMLIQRLNTIQPTATATNSQKQPQTPNAKASSYMSFLLSYQTTIAAARTGTVYRNNNKPDVMSGNPAETGNMIQPIRGSSIIQCKVQADPASDFYVMPNMREWNGGARSEPHIYYPIRDAADQISAVFST